MPSRPGPMLRATIAMLLVLCVVTACADRSGSTPTPEPIDPQGSWQLVAGHVGDTDVPIVEDHPITLTIEGSTIGGTSACNSYGARLEVEGGRLRIGELSMTAMGCEEPIMAAEVAYTGALGRVNEITMDGDVLVLRGPNVELRFEALPAPPTDDIVNRTWRLESVVVDDVASPPRGDLATLELRSDGTLSGSTGCRTFTGTWIEAGEQITTPNLVMTDIGCAPELTEQDGHVVAVIGDGFVPTVEGRRLTLSDPAGAGLVYVPANEE